ARIRVAPQAGLSLAVLAEDTWVCAQRSIGVDDRIGKACVELRIRFAGMELAQDRLATRRRRGKNAIRHWPVLIPISERNARVACRADAAEQVDDCGRSG